ncbi:A disintegrin and metalloproteinase with thrombospondin motifs 20 [Brienomyrus brachyistius]|uniref:A disintegrin and metalloproteinase with thrombospondin motifs 20 n=1 Tax=Brienomyrus brachyistius TaxID=42636 RepID=UPI0020B3ACF3|nr:A disintegrin and metalloproteinase with thrombospondin motifs 20 [Brienomyrus brachyistius]
MKFTVWFVGLACHLSAFALKLLDYRFHPKQENFIRQLSSYEIITPLRINDFGEKFPHSLHYRRKRRSADSHFPELRAHYKIDAFGQRFDLNLTADSEFIAPSYTVTHIGAKYKNTTDSQPSESDMRHCFFRGHVNNRRTFTAVFSLCTGLIGTFTTHSGDYFLEPLMKADGSEHEDEHSKPHLVYRHERRRSAPHTNIHLQDQTALHCNRSIDEEVSSVQEAVDFYHRRLPSSNSQKQSLSRRKRFLSYPRFVELMVTADNEMLQHHGHNLEHYILTIMSVVAAIYKDPSVGNLINIIIVKLVVIHDELEGPSVSSNAAATLHNFCVWQQTQNVQDDSDPSHHDTSLLITRKDICRTKNKCDTLGLAELGTMCDPQRSCSISEENGLSTSFTIAHELGHVFNMPHDDNSKCREATVKLQLNVMAPMLNYDTSPWTWSNCSRKYITEFLDTGYGECLLDEPSGRPYLLPRELPGQLFSANQQCELIFGPGSQVCPYMRQCKRLWCTTAEGENRGCRTQHMPLADGTHCGQAMHCRRGVCVHKEAETRPVNGGWGPWGSYSACSRSCGGGIRSATRSCNRPEPKNGGRFCVGRRMRFRSCSTDLCPRGRRDFREEQCAQFDGRHFNINGLPPTVRWVPKYSGVLLKDRCKLFCRVAGSTAYYQLRDRVVDGTPCGTDTSDICVQGLCRQAGCDRVLNSKARKDRCGVCGGDNSSCRTVSGTFSIAQYGYSVVTHIPAGASNIDIKQLSYSGKPEDDNYLVLSDSQSNFLLNGNFVVAMFKREIKLKGAVIEYSGSDVAEERINCSQRIREELVLQVLCVGNLHSPDVHYSYSVPVERLSQRYLWDPSGPWLDCSRKCQGERRRRAACVRESDRLVVSSQKCQYLPRPQDTAEACNADCELRWQVLGRSECSSRCGPGILTRDVRCVRYTLGGPNQLESDQACAHLPKPPAREPCHGQCLQQSWHYGAWSQCSKSCGGGSRTRSSYCTDHLGRRLAERQCAGVPRLEAEPCREEACPGWLVNEWSECLATCGVGVRRRQVHCARDQERLSDWMCDHGTKPSAVGPCQLPQCASWQAGPWAPCPVTCGRGYQMRAVHCVSGIHGRTVSDRECNAATRPIDSQDCDVSTCPPSAPALSTAQPSDVGQPRPQWRYGSWTACSVSCGRGLRARYVSCRDPLGEKMDESSCAYLPRPAESTACFSPCGQWRVGEWSPCSVTCGVGQYKRKVMCSTYSHQVEDSFCSADERPSAMQECRGVPCPSVYHLAPQGPTDPHTHPGHSSRNVTPVIHQWRTGPWGVCSQTCGGGFQRRAVVCQDADGRTASQCEPRVKPAESRSCDLGPCPQWVYGVWGECTQTCGGGQRSRLVVCQQSYGQSLNEHSCSTVERPADVERCNMQPCPGGTAWPRRPWKPAR